MTPVTVFPAFSPHYKDVPIKSYIAWPTPGKVSALEATLLQIPGCEVLTAENQELLLLVTDTPGEAHEFALLQQLETVEYLQCLSLVAGVTESEAA